MIKKLCIAVAALLLLQSIPATGWSSRSMAATVTTAYLHAFYPSQITYGPSLNKYIDQLDSLSFAWGQLDFSDTVSINTTKGLNKNSSFYFPADYIDPVKYAKSKGKPVQLCIFSNSSIARKVLTDAASANKLIDLVVEQATRNIAVKDAAAATTASAVSAAQPGASSSPASITTTPASVTTTPASIATTPDAIASETAPAASEAVTSGAVTSGSISAPEDEACYFDGIVIDFEGLRNTNADGTANNVNGKPISAYFNQFLQKLSTRLKAENKTLLVAVNTDNNFDGYDYKTIASVADRIILMAHDYEPVTNLKKYEVDRYYEFDNLVPTQSIAPYNEVKHAVNTIKSSIGNAALCKKVLLQLSFDAAQWEFPLNDPNGWEKLDRETLSTQKYAPTYELIKKRIDNADHVAVNISHGYNYLLECPYMSYYNPGKQLFNFIVYENSKSMSLKVGLASDAGLGGISVWALGNISDYSDPTGVAYKLNIWDEILKQVHGQTAWGLKAKPSGKAVRFADKKLEAYLRIVLEKPTGSLYEGDLLEINRLKLPPNTVSQYSDLKYMKNLEFLDASENSIEDLSFLTSLTNLKAIYLAKNKIRDLKPLARLKGLEVLSLNSNSISDLTPLSGLTNLKRLYLSNNRISSVKPLSKLVKLELLYLTKNPVKDISVLDKLTCKIEM
jgi:internalin A